MAFESFEETMLFSWQQLDTIAPNMKVGKGAAVRLKDTTKMSVSMTRKKTNIHQMDLRDDEDSIDTQQISWNQTRLLEGEREDVHQRLGLQFLLGLSSLDRKRTVLTSR